MWFNMRGATTWLLMLSVLSWFGCRVSASATHLIPDGYVGPVVIVFEDQDGKEPEQVDDGVIYRIPADGVLRLSTSAPKSGLYRISYFYLRSDGHREEISAHATDDGSLQVFADVVGTTAETNEGDGIRWIAYVVGIPGARDDWAQVRAKATAEAAGVPGVL